jgi:peroxiredoxin
MTQTLPLALLAALLTADPTPPDLGRVRDFALKDCRGKAHGCDEWQKASAVVLLLLNSQCPVSNGYSPELQRLATQWTDQSVLVYGVHCDPDATAEAIATHAKEYKLAFPMLLDPAQILARQAGATHTPEAIVLTSDGTVRYRGRIDDRWTEDGKQRPETRTHDLEKAVDAVRSGKIPVAAGGPVYGCPLPQLPARKANESGKGSPRD